ncbi:hypothetical protein HHI36_018342 [Cryptolaemus montrouzieri]|uniref:Uncharacterized protein n=1 Tax=Cryptolaemus montrouzieri TaxID=559131 RepID=A0ABD2NZQ1_9CUCU
MKVKTDHRSLIRLLNLRDVPGLISLGSEHVATDILSGSVPNWDSVNLLTFDSSGTIIDPWYASTVEKVLEKSNNLLRWKVEDKLKPAELVASHYALSNLTLEDDHLRAFGFTAFHKRQTFA